MLFIARWSTKFDCACFVLDNIAFKSIYTDARQWVVPSCKPAKNEYTITTLASYASRLSKIVFLITVRMQYSYCKSVRKSHHKNVVKYDTFGVT